MKNFTHEFTLSSSLEDTFDMVFNDTDTLDAVHGRGRYSVTPWSGDARNISCEMEPCGIPDVVLKVIGNGKMAASVKQTARRETDKITVTNRVRPRVLGAEFVRIRPTFTLSAVPGGTSVRVSCDVCAILPCPLDGIAEDFMKKTSEVSFGWLQKSLQKLCEP